jgi:hypothetical protein
MKTGLLTGAMALVISLATSAGDAAAVEPFWNHVAHLRAPYLSWYAPYYHVAFGQPVALVVPPTAEVHTDWGWGVGGTQIRPTWHQFARPYPGPMFGGGYQLPTPAWPSDTRQFGVYYIRGPW